MNEDHVSTAAPLRVLFVQSHTELGGAEVALLTLLRSLDRASVEPLFASLEFGGGDLPRQVERLGIPVFRLPAGRFRELGRTWQKIRGLRQIIREQAVHLVLANGGHPLLFARPAALWSGRPCVWWAHGPVHGDPLRGRAIAVAESLLSADTLLANSEFTAGELRQLLGGQAAIRVVHYGIDLERLHPAPAEGAAARRKLGIGEHENVIGIFGRLQPWKGQHVFLEAAAQLARRNVPCRCLIVGGSVFGLDAGYAERLKRMAADAGLNGRVAFLGQRSDINALLNTCDVVAHASVEAEPWGLVVAEAMAAGRAVVASAAGGPLEMIENGATGLLTPPGDSAALADAMESLLQQPERRRALGEAARRYAEVHFERRAAAAKMCEELRRVQQTFAARG